MTTRQHPWLPESVEREAILRLDWTSYQLIEACKRKASMAVSWRREPSSDTAALFFGQAIHAALDVRQKMLMRGQTDGILQAMETELERYWIGHVTPENEHRTLGRAKEVVGVYQQENPTEPFEIVASEQKREKELGAVSYAQANPGFKDPSNRCCTVIWQGIADGIWRNPETRECSVKDTKTSQRDEFAGDEEGEFSKGEAKYQMSGQLMGYCWLLSGDEYGPVTGAVLDQIVIRKPVAKVTARTPPQNECKRRFFSWTVEQIEEWRRDVLANVGEWLTACAQGTTPPPMTRTACAWPTVCGYFNSCVQKTEAARMERLMGPRFRQRTWDPMKAR